MFTFETAIIIHIACWGYVIRSLAMISWQWTKGKEKCWEVEDQHENDFFFNNCSSDEQYENAKKKPLVSEFGNL